MAAAAAQSNGDKPLTDAELHAALRSFEPEYKEESGPLTDDQRQIRVKRLQKYQKKDQEEREKQATKREREALKKEKETQKSTTTSLRSPGRSLEVASPARPTARSLEVASPARPPTRSVGVRSVEVRSTEVSTQSVLVEPETKKSRGGKRRSLMPESSVTLQGLSPGVGEGLERDASIVRTETVIQSPANNKKASTSSSSVAACIEVNIRDVTLGEAANNLSVCLYGLDTSKNWKLLAQRATSASGDCPGLITSDLFEKGLYKLHFDTGAYFLSSNIVPLFPCVEVVFEVVDRTRSYQLHIDLGPYSYTTSISS